MDENRNWTHLGINYLIANEKFRRKLFSDSTTDAKDENRRKVQASEGKSILYGELARVIFNRQEHRHQYLGRVQGRSSQVYAVHSATVCEVCNFILRLRVINQLETHKSDAQAETNLTRSIAKGSQ